MPPNWQSYVSVEDIEAAAERAKSLGATVLAEPFDVMDVGRMAVIQDPTGAVFSLWQSGRHFGAGLVNAPGALSWNQLNTNDVEGARKFYAQLFGWEDETFEEDGATYLTVSVDGWRNGGIMTMPEGVQAPPHWLVYFAVEDVEAAAAKVRELGGEVIVPPMDVPAGRITVARDPQGAVFGLFAGELDD